AVLGAGEDEEGEPQLVDEAEALDGPAGDQRRLQRIGADEAVDGVADRQHGPRSPLSWSRTSRPGDGRGGGGRGPAGGSSGSRGARARVRGATRPGAAACEGWGGRGRRRSR